MHIIIAFGQSALAFIFPRNYRKVPYVSERYFDKRYKWVKVRYSKNHTICFFTAITRKNRDF